MPKIGGLEVITRVHASDPEICIVVITGYATIGTAVDAMKAGAYDFSGITLIIATGSS